MNQHSARTLEEVVEEFLNRAQQGEMPEIEDYVRPYPHLAGELRRALRAALLMEQIGDVPTAPASSDVPPTPDKVGDYRIVRELGRGGMGVVYEAEQESLGRHVALKVLPHHLFAHQDRALERFRREARAAAKMHHTNIVPVFEVGNDGGTVFYAMQLIQGCSLDHVIDELVAWDFHESAAHRGDGVAERRAGAHRGGDTPGSNEIAAFLQRDEFPSEHLLDSSWRKADLEASPPRHTGATRNEAPRGPSSTRSRSDPPSVSSSSSSTSSRRHFFRGVARIGLQTAEALAYAHSRGVIHRDVKPSNLILDVYGVTWVSDFGLAKVDEEAATRTGDCVGTLRYMPPERFQGNGDERTDIYALGLTLYELLVLRPAFASDNRLQLVEMIGKVKPNPPRAIDPRIPLDLENIVLKAIEKDPRHRYCSAQALAADLRHFLNDEPVRARRVSWPERLWRWARRNRRLAASLLAIALLLSTLTVVSTLAAFREAHFREVSEARERDVQRNLYYVEMNLAGQAANTPGGNARVAELTSHWRSGQGQADLRDWEWFYLRARCDRELRTFATGITTVWSCRWSPDGTQLAYGGYSGAGVIDAVTGAAVELPVRQKNVHSVAWKHDGLCLATCSAGGQVCVWDVKTCALIRVFQHAGWLNSVAWSPQGPKLAAGGRAGVITIWDTDTGEVLRSIKTPDPELLCLSWHPTGTLIASAAREGMVRVWDVATGDERARTRQAQSDQRVTCIAWSPDGERLASTTNEGNIIVCDGLTLSTIRWQSASGGELTSVAWSPDGKQVATASTERTVRLHDAATGEQVRQLNGHTDFVNSIDWRHDGKELATAGRDGTIRVWSATNRNENRTLARLGRFAATCLDWSPNGQRLALIGAVEPPDVHLLNPTTGAMLQTLRGHDLECRSVCWNPDGTRVATSSWDETVIVWDPTTGDPVLRFSGHVREGPRKNVVHSLAWSPDGKQIVSGSHDGMVYVWDAVTGEVAKRLDEHRSIVHSVHWNPKKPIIATATLRGRILVWSAEPEGNIKLDIHAHDDNVLDVRWNPNGTRFASASADGTVKIWDGETGQRLITLREHFGQVRCVRWHPRGRRLATSSDDGTVKIWSLDSQSEILTISASADPVYGIAWSPDGKQLISASLDGQLRIWDATVGYARDSP